MTMKENESKISGFQFHDRPDTNCLFYIQMSSFQDTIIIQTYINKLFPFPLCNDNVWQVTPKNYFSME